jgi:CRISPR-associated protein (TIGR03984 family)
LLAVEAAKEKAGRLGGETSTLTAHRIRENRYVLWGNALDAVHGGKAPDPSSAGGGATTDAAEPAVTRWVGLSAARIGVLTVPVPRKPARRGRVYLDTVEYIQVVDKHGNAAVTEERLAGLSVDQRSPVDAGVYA